MYQVIATGSTGNCVIYHKTVMIDIGVPYSLIKPYLGSIQLVLLTHKHGDHINKVTLRRMVSERPTLRIGCCEWMKDHVSGIKNVDIYEIGKVYNYGSFSVSPVKLYHDVPNAGYRIFKGETKILHCTDTAHLDGITAKGYDLYAIEHNYNNETVFTSIAEKQARGEYAHQIGSINSHLSEQQARDFIFKNKGEKYQVLRLHETKS
jgi:phosphoribosyl 1,2-cyclic phosphodiesterase